MPTLSFSCPNCNKLHERIKPEMVGHKVRCQCGFVFRLGSKSDKLAWFSEELKRKKALKKKQQSEAPPLKSLPASPGPAGAFDLQPKSGLLDSSGTSTSSPSKQIEPAVPGVFEDGRETDFPVAPLIEVHREPRFDATSVQAQSRSARPESPGPQPNRPTSDPSEYPTEPYALGDLAAIPFGTVVERDDFGSVGASPPLAMGLTRSSVSVRGRRKKANRGRALDSSTGPVCSLVVTAIGLPGLIVVMILFAIVAIACYRLTTGQIGSIPGFALAGGEVAISNAMTGGLKFQLFLSIMMLLLYGVLGLAMVATAVAAILELSKRVFIGWPSKLSAIIASTVLVCLLLMFFASVFNLFQTTNAIEKAAGVAIDKSVLVKGIFGLAFRYCLYGLVPLGVMITGFARVLKR